MPPSKTVSTRPSVVCGVTSPKPSVKNVVPLMYRSMPNPDAPPGAVSRKPTPQWMSANENTNRSPTARSVGSARAAENGEQILPAVPLRKALASARQGVHNSAVEGPRRPEPARDPPGENDSLEHIPENDRHQNNAEDGC